MIKKLSKFLAFFYIILVVSCSQRQPAQVDYYGSYSKRKQQNAINSHLNNDTIIIKSGDTLLSLAKKYNVSYKDLRDYNNLNNDSILKIGVRLNIPRNQYHIVQPGENISKIAKYYNTSQSEIARLNNIPKPYKVKLGQKLVIIRNIVDKESNVNEAKETENKAFNSDYNPYTAVQIKPLEELKTDNDLPKEEPAVEPQTLESIDVPKLKQEQVTIPSKFIWPLKGKIISTFGVAPNGIRNDGVNIQAPAGTDIKAAASGVVAYSSNGLKGYGNLIIIKHGDNILTAYAHLKDLLIQKGAKVTQNQIIGHVGNTGDISSAQLHFAVRKDKKPIDPLLILPAL